MLRKPRLFTNTVEMAKEEEEDEERGAHENAMKQNT
jgi:hypothetical protein